MTVDRLLHLVDFGQDVPGPIQHLVPSIGQLQPTCRPQQQAGGQVLLQFVDAFTDHGGYDAQLGSSPVETAVAYHRGKSL